MRMAWRLVLSLFGHLTVLFFLAVYLISSLNSVRLYTPVAHAEEVQIESLNTVPALLGAMDAERRSFPEERGCARPDALFADAGVGGAQPGSLQTPLVLPSELENKRRALVQNVDFRGGRLWP